MFLKFFKDNQKTICRKFVAKNRNGEIGDLYFPFFLLFIRISNDAFDKANFCVLF